ncbi:MAG: hypothetical protein AB7U49_14610 [Hyphomicrobiaceae bacterium]
MVDAIQTAVSSGNIDDLRTPFEWNELPPSVADEKVSDPIAHWRKQSRDGEGREILAILADLLSLGATRLPIGRDPENSGVYVWPYMAELPLDKLTPQQIVELYRIVPAEKAAEMQKQGTWTWYRLVIGADGTWHSFMEHP